MFKNYETDYRLKYKDARSRYKWDSFGKNNEDTLVTANSSTSYSSAVVSGNETNENVEQSISQRIESALTESANICEEQNQISPNDIKNTDAVRNNDMENESTYDIEERYSDDDAISDLFSNDIRDTDDFSFRTTDTDNSEANEFDYEDQQFDDRKIMFETSKLTINDVMTLVMAFSIRFKISEVGRSELINMIKLFAGPQVNDINISKYRFQQKFDPPNETSMIHYYCMSCKQQILYYINLKERFRKQKKRVLYVTLNVK
ncbi:uncharacterized protein LOC100679876 [Nasonia vitripennis]|uniref:Uncharacterized protein n=1 Tax=Nasonia vitripennis TaxID=7425 RepID=A0A7M7Q9D8_NASVI|nr:uncharacterized protein LOC100679876 [Nasonia vitripennis]